MYTSFLLPINYEVPVARALRGVVNAGATVPIGEQHSTINVLACVDIPLREASFGREITLSFRLSDVHDSDGMDRYDSTMYSVNRSALAKK